MDMAADYETPTHLEEQAEIKALMDLKPFYDELAVNFEHYETVLGDGVQTVSQKEYHVVLYMKPSCPYCVRVMNYLNSIGETIQMKDVGRDPEAYRELITTGRKNQVPCLFINGQPLYESSLIIQWLGDHKGQY